MSGAHELLGEAIAAFFAPATLTASRQRPWASATFSGARHFYTLDCSPDPALSDALPEHEFTIPNHLVADICVVAQRDMSEFMECQIEALTVEDA